MSIRLGKIGYLNVLPIYYPLENGLIDNDFEIVSGPPATLNRLMATGDLSLSAASSIEYARNSDQYSLIPRIAIGSCGPVQSVLLLSRYEIDELNNKKILVSSQTHTSAALLQVLQQKYWKIDVEYSIGDATQELAHGEKPDAILAIGDEALNLRFHEEYPIRIDLGEAWRDITQLPFIFGVWIVQKQLWQGAQRKSIHKSCQILLEGKDWGIENINFIYELAAKNSCLTAMEMASYFNGLVYDLGEPEIRGMQLFYSHLKECGIIKKQPNLEFLSI